MISRRSIAIFILGLIFLPFSESVSATSCISPTASEVKGRIIYLHGMDSISPSAQELGNRKILKKISKELSLSIAIPRAKDICPKHKNQICWMWGTEANDVVRKKKVAILKEIKDCTSEKSNDVWLGFSNGGNLVTQFLQECSSKEKYISFGASGGYVKSNLSNLSECGVYKAFIGKKDKWNYSHAIKYYNNLKDKKSKIDVIEFDGGHNLEYDLLKKAIKELL